MVCKATFDWLPSFISYAYQLCVALLSSYTLPTFELLGSQVGDCDSTLDDLLIFRQIITFKINLYVIKVFNLMLPCYGKAVRPLGVKFLA